MADANPTAPTLSGATPAAADVHAASLILLRACDDHSWRAKALAEALAILSDSGDDLPLGTVDAIAHQLSRHVAAMAHALHGAHETLVGRRAGGAPGA